MGGNFTKIGEVNMRNTLLSFLGTNNYIECNYTFEDRESGVVKFVQEAMIKLFCNEWNRDDRILIFLTKDAKEKNWENQLERRISTNINIETVDIPDGLNEKEIWEIFRIVFDKINDNDKIIYDITHSFRSLPMLGIVLMNYSKLLKNIKVNGIYYGAFETLGPVQEVKNKFPNPADRKPPIFDLTSFSNLQDWTNASSLFLNFGITGEIEKLAENKFLPLLQQSKGKDIYARNLRNLSKNLNKMSKSMHSPNGPEIIKGKFFSNIENAIKNSDLSKFVPAFQPLLTHISKSIDDFHFNNVMNGFEAVRWCINNNLTQQGFTLLQESLITYIASKFQIDYLNLEIRDDISKAFYILANKIKRQNWKVSNVKLLDKLIKDNEVKKLKNQFQKITKLRNELNHAAFRKNVDPNKNYEKELNNLYNEIKKVINNAH